jgi:hypothetical protein
MRREGILPGDNEHGVRTVVMGNDAGHGSVVDEEGDLVADDQKDEGDRPDDEGSGRLSRVLLF